MTCILNWHRKMKDINKYFYAGTSGLVLPYTKEHFPSEYKQKSRLHYYASINNSIEINRTFYKLPKESTLVKWKERVPKDFQFAFKIPKNIIHVKDLNFSLSDIEIFFKVVESVGEKRILPVSAIPSVYKN